MKKELLDILCCPHCKGTFQLSVEKEEQNEIIEGKLICQHCCNTYEIKDEIPNLLPKNTS